MRQQPASNGREGRGVQTAVGAYRGLRQHGGLCLPGAQFARKESMRHLWAYRAALGRSASQPQRGHMVSGGVGGCGATHFTDVETESQTYLLLPTPSPQRQGNPNAGTSPRLQTAAFPGLRRGASPEASATSAEESEFLSLTLPQILPPVLPYQPHPIGVEDPL